jgi:hypothetical protein
MDSLDLNLGPRRAREIVNDGEGLVLVWAGQSHIATLHPGQSADFIPLKRGGWTCARRRAAA